MMNEQIYLDNAIWWQSCAAHDYRNMQSAMERGDIADTIAWQRFAANASAKARGYLFLILERGK